MQAKKLHFEPRSVIDSVWKPRKLERVEYTAEQPEGSPDSTVIISFSGDGICIPDIEVLIYVMPLQMATCNIVSVWNSGWGRGEDPRLIRNIYRNRRIGDSSEIAVSIIESAANIVSKHLEKNVRSRVEYLENEQSKIEN